MQLTEKIRKGILLYLTEITQAEADRIAATNAVGAVTVYRYWKLIRTNKPVEINNITLAIAELAASKKPKAKTVHKRLAKITRQLSAA
jgi:cytochrome b